MDPASIAAATGIAGLVREYGVTGLLALSILANVWLVKKWGECTEARIADAGRLAALVEKASQTMAAVGAALESRTGIFERLGGTIEQGHREADMVAAAIKGAVDELRRVVDDVRRKVGA